MYDILSLGLISEIFWISNLEKNLCLPGISLLSSHNAFIFDLPTSSIICLCRSNVVVWLDDGQYRAQDTKRLYQAMKSQAFPHRLNSGR